MDIEKYKLRLKELNMTYEDLSKTTGLSLGCIKRIMAGIARYPRIDTIEAIEKALGTESQSITHEERLAGLTELKKESITPIEDDMLYVFREIGKKYGLETQKAAITMLENMLNIKN